MLDVSYRKKHIRRQIMSAYSISALEILRNPALTLKWYVVPLLLVVMYVYNKEISAKNWNVVLGGAALWGMDLFNEIHIT